MEACRFAADDGRDAMTGIGTVVPSCPATPAITRQPASPVQCCVCWFQVRRKCVLQDRGKQHHSRRARTAQRAAGPSHSIAQRTLT